jgi:hypothetical protein
MTYRSKLLPTFYFQKNAKRKRFVKAHYYRHPNILKYNQLFNSENKIEFINLIITFHKEGNSSSLHQKPFVYHIVMNHT